MSNVINFPTVSRAFYDAHTALVEAFLSAAEEAHATGLLRPATALKVHEAMRVYFEKARAEMGDEVLRQQFR